MAEIQGRLGVQEYTVVPVFAAEREKPSVESWQDDSSHLEVLTLVTISTVLQVLALGEIGFHDSESALALCLTSVL